MSRPDSGIGTPEQDQSVDKCSQCPHTSAYPLRKTNQAHVSSGLAKSRVMHHKRQIKYEIY